MNSNQLIRCRIFGHAWDEVSIGAVTDDYVSPVGYREVLALKCMRCGTARIDSWNRWGGLGGRRYIYDEDYKQLNLDLRENHKPDESARDAAKKRYLAARREAMKQSDQEATG